MNSPGVSIVPLCYLLLALLSLHGGSLEITLTVPLIMVILLFYILITFCFFNAGVSYDSFPCVDESSIRKGSFDQPTASVGEASSVLETDICWVYRIS